MPKPQRKDNAVSCVRIYAAVIAPGHPTSGGKGPHECPALEALEEACLPSGPLDLWTSGAHRPILERGLNCRRGGEKEKRARCHRTRLRVVYGPHSTRLATFCGLGVLRVLFRSPYHDSMRKVHRARLSRNHRTALGTVLALKTHRHSQRPKPKPKPLQGKTPIKTTFIQTTVEVVPRRIPKNQNK